MTKQKPALSISQIINMSMGFLGIQMAFGLQNGNASRILANFGAEVDQLSWFWLVAPVAGLVVQPLIGHLGDNTWGKFGRRKPYFLVGAVLCAVGLVFLPNAATVNQMLAANVLLLAVLFLAMMDMSVNVAMEPFRALVGDMLPKKQGTLGFSVQTILIGVGAALGSYMPSWLKKLGVNGEAAEGFVPENVIYSFYFGAAILLLSIIYTIFTTKEYSPQQLAEFENEKADPVQQTKFKDLFSDFKNIPVQMKKLGLVQFFSWFALFTMWVYTSSALATHHFGLSPEDTKSQAFNSAGDFTGALFGQYNLWAIPFAFLLTPIASKIGKKQTHALALFLGGLGLVLMNFMAKEYLWISMVGLGFAWASILAMPYAMLIDVIPQRKMGVFMGIFNFFIVIPQIINGVVGGPIVKNIFGNYAMGYVMAGGFCMILGALITLFFITSDGGESHAELEQEIQQPHF